MKWLLAPASDRALMRRVVARIDQILGYPRTHAEDEVIRRGRGPHAPTVRTESQTVVMVHDATGATILHGAIAVGIDDVVEALRERQIDHGGVRKRIREWIADQGWEVRASLPGAEDAWTRVEPRDGAEGSEDGRPIPEDEESTAQRA